MASNAGSLPALALEIAKPKAKPYRLAASAHLVTVRAAFEATGLEEWWVPMQKRTSCITPTSAEQ
jgi:hypothetical protein